MQCLLLLGLSINGTVKKEGDEEERYEQGDTKEEEFSSLDLDDPPKFVEAMKILFSALRIAVSWGWNPKGYEMEMKWTSD